MKRMLILHPRPTRKCFLEPHKFRPGCCGAGPRLSRVKFYDDIYLFWAVDTYDGDTVTVRIPVHSDIMLEDRLASLEDERTLIIKQWAADCLVDVVKRATYDHHLRCISYKVTRPDAVRRYATQCEIIAWLGNHSYDADEVTEDLDIRFRRWGIPYRYPCPQSGDDPE